jgi:hypothetical protein
MTGHAFAPPKAAAGDHLGRYREIVSDPLNLLIERVPMAGVVEGTDVYLHNGHRVPLNGPDAYYGRFSQILVINRGVHEPLEEFVFQEVLRRLRSSPLMIELGAYWGHYSMWLKKVRPDATVIMVEPVMERLAIGQANFARNGYGGEFIHASVGAGQWELDRFVAARGISHIDVLHVDVQGHEAVLLDGGRKALGEGLVDHLFVSTHSQDLHRHVVDALARLGYRVEVSSDFSEETTSYDGFVLAHGPNTSPVFRDFPHLGRARIATSRADDLVQAVLNACNSVI